MKLIISFTIILSIFQIETQPLTLFEWNFLYQFGDLDTDQFNYLDPELLRYIFRMKNNFRTLNYSFAKDAENRSAPDFACIVEWNANKKSRYYIPTPSEYLDIKHAMAFTKNDFPKELIVAKLAYQKLIKDMDDMVDKINESYKKKLKEAEIAKPELKKALDNYKTASKNLKKQEAIELKKKYDDLLTEMNLEDPKKEIKKATEKFKSTENFVNAKSKYESEDKKYLNSLASNLEALTKYLIEYGNIPKGQVIDENTILPFFMKKIGELRKEYDDEFFPYDDFKFTEYIPTDKISKEKKGKGDDLGEFDRKRWYVFNELWSLFETLGLYQEIDYNWHITMKSTGALHRDGDRIEIRKTGAQQIPPTYSVINVESKKEIEEKVVQGEKFQKNFEALEANKSEMKDNKSPKQSILFMYNKEKFACESPKTVAVWSSKEDGLDSQNFVVHECYFKNKEDVNDKSSKVVVICTHYKSKDDGFDSRMAIGNEITKYVNKYHPNDNIVLMGDLNAEIGEIATSLDAKVQRRSQTNKNDLTTYVPNPDMQMRGRKLTEEQSILIQKIKDLNKVVEDSKIKYMTREFMNSANQEFIKSLEENKKTLITLTEEFERNLASGNKNNNSYNTWSETSSLPTESKIRIKQIDYFNPKFLRFIQEEQQSNIDIGGCFTKFTELISKNEKNLKHNPLVKEAFILWTNCLRENVKIEAAKDKLDSLIESLIEEEKIDYILLSFKNRYEVKEVYKIQNYTDHLQRGCPNETFSSDHLPTHVKLEINFSRNFIFSPKQMLSSYRRLVI
jgi:hypothetical protein